MTTLAHVSAGYLTAQLINYINPSLGFGRPEIIVATIVGGNFPDLDILFVKKKEHHRNTYFHAPLFWLGIIIGGYFITWLFGIKQLSIYVAAFGLGLLSHFFTDWFAARDKDIGGVPIFFPFSKKHYGFMPDQKIKFAGFENFSLKKFIEYYTENIFIFLVEVLLVILAVAIFLSRNAFFRLGIFL